MRWKWIYIPRVSVGMAFLKLIMCGGGGDICCVGGVTCNMIRII
jgi:hypothetical protein